MGREVVAAITNGKLDFGPWEQTETIFFVAVGIKGNAPMIDGLVKSHAAILGS